MGEIYYDIFKKDSRTLHFVHQNDFDRVYSLIMAITGSHEEAINAESWCELAGIGDTYEHELFTIKITLDV